MLFVSILMLLNYYTSSEASNILAVLPVPGKSHCVFLETLLIRLAEKGHNVTVYTPFPKKFPNLPNYVNVNTDECFRQRRTGQISDNSFSLSPLHNLIGLPKIIPKRDVTKTCSPLANLLTSSAKYDLFITETFHHDVPLVFAVKFKVPLITITPNAMFPWLSDRMGNTNNPSYIPTLEIGLSEEMTFWQRVENTFVYTMSLILHDYYCKRHTDVIIRDTFGSSAPSTHDMIRKVSLMFVSSNFGKPIPLVPGVVNVAGMHINPVPGDLPQVHMFS